MLQYRTVYPTTLELLKKLMQYESLRKSFLVGGTALALQLGHRISVDIDLFSEIDFETNDILTELRKDLELQVIMQKEKNSLILNARLKNTNNEFIKIDFVKYVYPLLNELKHEDGIRLLSVEDIIPMKLSAIANRGAKKDFFDIYELMKTFSLSDMFRLFSKKYPDISHFHIVKSLTYFEDAEVEFDPIMLNDTDWETVKQTIEDNVSRYV